MKTIRIKINIKPIWCAAKGHPEHRSGAGQHDNRVKRLRTRGAVVNRILQDWK